MEDLRVKIKTNIFNIGQIVEKKKKEMSTNRRKKVCFSIRTSLFSFHIFVEPSYLGTYFN